mmetsp:Transcript_6365/g.16061  ORF Transcript_6365/g.16061 Transcript_6365/m.16061 type:complete len:465 (+) Transcript_6365:155-1549(+)
MGSPGGTSARAAGAQPEVKKNASVDKASRESSRSSVPETVEEALDELLPALARADSEKDLMEVLEEVPLEQLLAAEGASPAPEPSALPSWKKKRVYSFAACGWLKLYYFGVAKRLQEEGMLTDARFMGSSAGSLVSCALALELDFDKIAEFQKGCVKRTHGGIWGAFQLSTYIHEIIDNMLPHNAADVLKDKCEISYTTLPWFKNKRVKVYRDEQHIRQALLASCCMAPLAGLPFRLDGELVYDGALSDWIKSGLFHGPNDQAAEQDEPTITITPFWFSRSDIRPSQYIPLWWAVYPPKVEDFEWIFDLGYKDTGDWVRREEERAARPVEEVTLGRLGSASVRFEEAYAEMKHVVSGKPTQGAFTRMFGYRSIVRLLPSWFFDLYFVLLVYLLIRPVTVFCIYLECFVKGFLHSSKRRRKLARKCLVDPKLAIRCLPIPWVRFEINRKELWVTSIVYRLCMHFV